jgi:hypothetical protein
MVVKRDRKLSIHQLAALRLLKELNLKGTPPANMKGGCMVCDWITKQHGGTMDPDARRQLANVLNRVTREARRRQSGSGQNGGNIIKDLFTGKKAKKFWGDFGKGFVKGFTGTAKIAAPLLDVASIFQPELAPVAVGVHALNKAL